jgi:hypothetical protein
MSLNLGNDEEYGWFGFGDPVLPEFWASYRFCLSWWAALGACFGDLSWKLVLVVDVFPFDLLMR